MDPRIARGVAELNARNFFAAHEIWEEVWLETVGPERLLLQGLIQIAAGYLKAESGNHSATQKLLTKGLGHVRGFAPSALGLALQPFITGVEADLELTHRLGPMDFHAAALRMPRLEPIPAGAR